MASEQEEARLIVSHILGHGDLGADDMANVEEVARRLREAYQRGVVAERERGVIERAALRQLLAISDATRDQRIEAAVKHERTRMQREIDGQRGTNEWLTAEVERLQYIVDAAEKAEAADYGEDARIRLRAALMGERLPDDDLEPNDG